MVYAILMGFVLPAGLPAFFHLLKVLERSSLAFNSFLEVPERLEPAGDFVLKTSLALCTRSLKNYQSAQAYFF